MKMCRMMVIISFIPLCIVTSIVAQCYPNYCNRSDILLSNHDINCVITPVLRNLDCVNIKFDRKNETFAKYDVTKYKLLAYVKEINGVKSTAFNFSMTDITFYKMLMRYQNLADENLSFCRRIELNRNSSDNKIKELYISCPFEYLVHESMPYHLEYMISGENYEYSRELVFIVPDHLDFDEKNNIYTFTPFTYVDVTNISSLTLYIQPLPKIFNATKYRVWLINNITNSVLHEVVNSSTKQEHISLNYIVEEGIYFFRVAALHPDCNDFGCVNSTSPFIKIKQVKERLIVMIISTVWLPPVMVYALYVAYKYYTYQVLEKRKKKRHLSCLLMYAHSHTAHIKVIANLARYLRNCGINAMLDIFDIPEMANKDPGLWCNMAFQKADYIFIVTSPSFTDEIPTIYYNIDNYILQLIKENFSKRNKIYYIIELPYCRTDNLPEEVKHFNRFRLPEQLPKLIKALNSNEYLYLFNNSDKELLNSIQMAKLEIKSQGPFIKCAMEKNQTKITHDIGSALAVIQEETMLDNKEKSDIDSHSETRKPEVQMLNLSYATDIHHLNLFGEHEENEDQSLITSDIPQENGFYIQNLEL